MLFNGSRLINTPILSLQTGTPIGSVESPIIDPDSLKIIGFIVHGPLIGRNDENILDISSIREYAKYGMVVDSSEELFFADDVIRIKKVLDLNFDLIGKKVKTKKGIYIGKVSSYTFIDNDFIIKQLIVQRPPLKAILDPELTIPRSEIIEINDSFIIIKDETKKQREAINQEEFVPNFVNPFRKNSEPDYVPSHMQNPDEQDTE